MIKITQIVHKFTTTYHHLLQQHNPYASLHTLNLSISGPLTLHQSQQYEKLDKLRFQSILKAEKTCRKLKVGGIEFSPKLQHQRDRINLLRNVKSKKEGNKVSIGLISRLEKKVGTAHTLSYPMHTIQSELSDAFTKYKRLKK